MGGQGLQDSGLSPRPVFKCVCPRACVYMGAQPPGMPPSRHWPPCSEKICFQHKKMSLSVWSQHLALQTASCIVDAQSKYLSATGICSYLKFFFEPILFSFYGISNCFTLGYLSFLVLCFYDRDIYAKMCKSLHPHRRAS